MIEIRASGENVRKLSDTRDIIAVFAGVMQENCTFAPNAKNIFRVSRVGA